VTRSSERGTATVEFVWLALLLLVPLVYVLVAVFDTQRAAFGVSTASRAAALAFLQSSDTVTGERRAQAAAGTALADQGVDGASVRVTCLPAPSACFEPGSSVRVVVRASQRLPLTPKALGSRLGGITVDSTHTESYGSYRAGR
jgi:Flp pilus assembly protein TadG